MKMIAAVAVMTLPLLYVWERVDVVQVGYRIQQLKAEYRILERENDELKVKVSALTSPERIARIATEQLGMMRPQPGQVVLVSFGQEVPGLRSPNEGEIQLAGKNENARRPGWQLLGRASVASLPR